MSDNKGFTKAELMEIVQLVMQAKEEAGQPVKHLTIHDGDDVTLIDNSHNLKKEDNESTNSTLPAQSSLN